MEIKLAGRRITVTRSAPPPRPAPDEALAGEEAKPTLLPRSGSMREPLTGREWLSQRSRNDRGFDWLNWTP